MFTLLIARSIALFERIPFDGYTKGIKWDGFLDTNRLL